MSSWFNIVSEQVLFTHKYCEAHIRLLAVSADVCEWVAAYTRAPQRVRAIGRMAHSPEDVCVSRECI